MTRAFSVRNKRKPLKFHILFCPTVSKRRHTKRLLEGVAKVRKTAKACLQRDILKSSVGISQQKAGGGNTLLGKKPRKAHAEKS